MRWAGGSAAAEPLPAASAALPHARGFRRTAAAAAGGELTGRASSVTKTYFQPSPSPSPSSSPPPPPLGMSTSERPSQHVNGGPSCTSPSKIAQLRRSRRHCSGRKCVALVVPTAVLLLLLLLLYAPSSTSHGSHLGARDSASFSVLVDAGSSGSRVHVYRYQSGTVEEVHPHSSSFATKTNTPALSSFAHNPEGAFASIEQLLETASALVPRESHKHTPLRVWATAGLRLLTSQQQESIFKHIEKRVHVKFAFHLDPHQSFQIISGRHEAVYAWLTLNYLVFAMSPSASTKQTAALLEMGGASLQLCYEVDDDEWARIPEKFRFESNFSSYQHLPRELARNIRLFAVSWLGYGAGRARATFYDRTLSRPLENSSGHLHVRDACVQAGVIDEILPHATLHGQGDVQACEKNITEVLLADSRQCSSQNGRGWWRCGMEGVGLPWPKRPDSSKQTVIYGTRAFFFSANDVIGMSGEFDSMAIRHQWAELCSSETHVQLNLAPKHCFQIAWVSSVLGSKGLDLASHSESHVVTINTVHGIEISWQLGAALYHPPDIHISKLPTQPNFSEFALHRVVLVVTFIGMVALIVMYYLVRRSTLRFPRLPFMWGYYQHSMRFNWPEVL